MKKIVFITVIIFMISNISYGKKVRITTLTNYKPFCFHKPGTKGINDIIPSGKTASFFDGMAWEILKESYHAMGYTIELSVVPWKRALYRIDKGDSDITFPAVKTTDREKIYYFSRELSYPPNHFLIYVLKNSKMRWNGLKSLNGKVVGSMRGFSYGKKWEEYSKAGNAKIISYDKISTGFLLLDKMRYDAIVGYEHSFEYSLKQLSIRDKYKSLPPFGDSKSFLMGKKSLKIKELLEVFDKGKKKIRGNGKLKKILLKWGFGSAKGF